MTATRTLLTPLQIGGTTEVRNRLYRAPVLEGAGDGDDAPAIYAKHFVENAHHGAGLIIQGSACLSEEGRSSPGMTVIDTREKVLRFAPMVDAVHAEGAAIWLQIGHGGLYSMESWHEPYASQRRGPLLAPSKPPIWVRFAFRKTPVHAMTTDEVYAMARKYGEIAEWAREAGYDGVQLASSNAKLVDQFLSPFYNRRDDEFGGSTENRARILRLIREAVAERAGADYTCTVKVPIGEKAPPFLPHTTWDEGVRVAELAQEWGFDSITPVHVSVLPDTTLSRGGIPTSLWRNPSMKKRFRAAAPSRFNRGVLTAGYVFGSIQSPFKPVWNRSRFAAMKQHLAVPVFAVGGIRTADEVDEILDGGQADMVGIGRPFYAEPDLAARILAGDAREQRCQYSNLCVPAQMLGMKGVCYNPAVVRVGVRASSRRV